MSDDALIAWLNEGAPVQLDSEAARLAAAAKRHTDFSQRFFAALSTNEDLGETQELHEQAVAQRVFAVHMELNALGEEEYQGVWGLLPPPTRRALKAYVAMASSLTTHPGRGRDE